MALDFPASPTVGQKYPQPAVSGVPVYTWDGEKWTTLGGAIGSTGASDAIPLIDAGTGAAGSSTLWSRGDHVHPPGAPSAVVRYDIAQSLTAPQQQQARQNVYAAPFDALAYNGLQINGGFEVSQEKGAAATTASGGYVCDGWILGFGGTMVPASAISNQSAKFPGFSSSIYINLSTAQTTLGANDFVTLTQKIEGYRTSRLMWGTPSAQPITLCFWSAHHRPGLYSGVVRNGAANRSYAFTYTQAVPDVQQYNVVTIPGDTSGTWTIDNSLGIALVFVMACGSTYTAPSANAWVAGSYAAAPGQINGVASTTDVFLITGVTVLPGSEAPLYARSPFVMRPYDQELVMCQRYWRAFLPGGAGLAATGGNVRFQVQHHGMRATPTASVSQVMTVSNIGTANFTQSAANVSIIAASADGGEYSFDNFTGLTPSAPLIFRAGGILRLDARL